MAGSEVADAFTTTVTSDPVKVSPLDEIKHTLDIFIESEATCELRFLGSKTTYKASSSNGGFFDNTAKMAEVASAIDQTPEYEGIYFTLNPINRDLLGRAYNKMIKVNTTGKLTKAENVLKRRWMLVDVDIKVSWPVYHLETQNMMKPLRWLINSVRSCMINMVGLYLSMLTLVMEHI